MTHITDLLPHFFQFSVLAVLGFFSLGLILLPFCWLQDKLETTRCQKCRGFFKRKLVDWEISEEKEVLKTVNRVDQGTVYSNGIFEPNHVIEINRQEQVVFVEQTFLYHWTCKDILCGHKWTTDEIIEHEGSLS